MKKGICGLYCFKNKNNEIIYIGKADDIHKRLKKHEHLPEECYEEIYSIEYVSIPNKADRDILETLLISRMKPKYNTRQIYEQESTLLIDSSLMLIWQKINPAEYNFKLQHQKYINKKSAKYSNCNGRPKIEMPQKFYDLYPDWKAGKLTAKEMANEIGISKSTFYRRIHEYEHSK